MPKMLKSVLVASIGLAIAGAAYAQSPVSMSQACNHSPCIYNSRNTLIGIAWPDGVLARQITSGPYPGWYQMGFSKAGINIDAVLFYTTPNCTGQPYSDSNSVDWLPQFVQYDGNSLWGKIGPETTVVWKSDYYFNPQDAGCQEYCPGGCSALLVPAGKVETEDYYPPFKIE